MPLIEKDWIGYWYGRHVQHRNIRSVENIAVVAQSVEEDPNMSIPYYRRMLSDHFWRETPDYKLEDMWFQQHKATGHSTLPHRAVLQKKLPEHVKLQSAVV